MELKNNLKALTLLALIVTAPVVAQEVGHKSLNDAAKAALTAAVQVDDQKEVGGCIYKVDGQFYFSTPIASQSDANLVIKCSIPKGSLSGLYHTHPMNMSDEGFTGFSPDDVATSEEVNVPSFIKVDGKLVLRYDPRGVADPSSLRLSSRGTRGRTVL